MRCATLVLALGILSCREGGPSGAPPFPLAPQRPGIADVDPIIQLELPAVIGAWVGVPTDLRLDGRTRAGHTEALEGVEWSSLSPEVVRIEASAGRLTAVAPGRGRIAARWRELSATAEILATVQCRGPALIPQGPQRVYVGETARWTAVLRPCGTTAGEPVTWSSSDSLVLRFGAEGVGTGLRPGLVMVSAWLVRTGDVSSIPVVVEPVP